MSKKEKYHYIYKTTCKITNRYYIGMHSTFNLNDGYMGSGRRLKHSLKKYGIDNHEKVILEFCKTRDLLAERESEIVTETLVNEHLCMNLRPGGYGGFSNVEHQKKCTAAGLAKISQLWTDPDYRKRESEAKRRISMTYNTGQYLKVHDTFSGKNHTDSTKQKMRDAKLGKLNGSANPSYGTCWVTKDNCNKKIKRDDLPQYQSDGWISGRVMIR